MIPASKDITIRRGDTFRYFFRLRQKDPLTGDWGSYQNLTTWGAALAQVRTAVDGTVLFTMTGTKADQTAFPGGMLLTIAAGTGANQTAGASFPASLAPGVWDCQLTNDLGEVDTYLAGIVTFTKDVSF